MSVDSLVLEQISQVLPPATSSCGSQKASRGGTSRLWRFRGTSFSAFVAPPCHTSSREDDVQPVVAAAMRHPPQAKLHLDTVASAKRVVNRVVQHFLRFRDCKAVWGNLPLQHFFNT